MSDDLASFAIQSKPTGMGAAIINGESIDYSALSYHCQPGQPPVLRVQLAGATGTITGEGIVQVELKGQAEKDAIKRFLKSVSPSDLDARVCEKMEWESGSPMKLALDALWEMIDVSS